MNAMAPLSTTVDSAVRKSWGQWISPERLGGVLRHAAPGGRVLDLGAGAGLYTFNLVQRGFDCIGVDRERYAEWDADIARFRQCDGADLPFPDKSFDTAIAFEVLEHCPDPDRILKEVARCTARRLVLSVPNCDLGNKLWEHKLVPAHWTDRTHCCFFTKPVLGELLERAGYRVLEMGDCVRISPNAYFWDSIRLPRPLARALARACERLRLVETYWSSILAVAAVPGADA